jgi:hypothetical protein
VDDPEERRAREAREALSKLDRQRVELEATLRQAQALLERLESVTRRSSDLLERVQELPPQSEF